MKKLFGLLVGAGLLVLLSFSIMAAAPPDHPEDIPGVCTVSEVGDNDGLIETGESVLYTCTGFDGDHPTYVSYHEPFCCVATYVWTGSGDFSIQRPVGAPGLYTTNFRQGYMKVKGEEVGCFIHLSNKCKLTLVESVSFEVK